MNRSFGFRGYPPGEIRCLPPLRLYKDEIAIVFVKLFEILPRVRVPRANVVYKNFNLFFLFDT